VNVVEWEICDEGEGSVRMRFGVCSPHWITEVRFWDGRRMIARRIRYPRGRRRMGC
jgi:hypothetical protein